ncbi:MAG TPA: VOC family protein [Bacteroidales bacterium]|nr:VOC family protein [Bacteroidales bacterium]
MIKTSFLHIGVTCENPSRFEEFYSKYFGFKRVKTIMSSNGQEIVFIKNDNNTCIEIFQADENSPVEKPSLDGPHYSAWKHIAFLVESIDDKLKEMGADTVISLGPKTLNEHGWRAVWIKDPEGNIIELTEGYKE